MYSTEHGSTFVAESRFRSVQGVRNGFPNLGWLYLLHRLLIIITVLQQKGLQEQVQEHDRATTSTTDMSNSRDRLCHLVDYGEAKGGSDVMQFRSTSRTEPLC